MKKKGYWILTEMLGNSFSYSFMISYAQIRKQTSQRPKTLEIILDLCSIQQSSIFSSDFLETNFGMTSQLQTNFSKKTTQIFLSISSKELSKKLLEITIILTSH